MARDSDSPGPHGEGWEAAVLADGRQYLERRSRRLRYRHLYPDGPNAAIIFEAFQAVDRLVAVGRLPPGGRRLRNAMRREIRRRLDVDATCRQAHVLHRVPPPMRHPVGGPVPPAIVQALAQVDGDVRADVAAWVLDGRVRPPPSSEESMIDPRHTQARFERGVAQFREALLYTAMADPESLRRLHPQVVEVLVPPFPPRLGHPVAVAVLLKAPLYLWMALLFSFNVLYLLAFVFFNDAVLGRFVSQKVSSILDGELEIREIHWRPRLIVDFLLGRPTPLIARGVSIYEPYKSVTDPRGRKAVATDEIHLAMTLHEIVPWNRLGVPTVFDIPWVLHFSDVEGSAPVTFWIRRYETTRTDGTPVSLLGLRDAFRLYGLKPNPKARGLSVRLDDAALDRVFVEIDDRPLGGWAAAAEIRRANVWIDFASPLPQEPPPAGIPFRFRLSADLQRGLVEIAGKRFPLRGGRLASLASGVGRLSDGDVGVALQTEAAGSPMAVQGTLYRVFRYDAAIPSVDLALRTEDGGPFTKVLLGELDIDPHRVDATHSPARVHISGPLSNPDFLMTLAARSVDLADEPAWVATDVAATLLAHRRRVPAAYRTSATDPDAARWQFLFRNLTFSALDGRARLVDPPGVIVMPELPDEPWIVAGRLSLAGVDPAGLAPDAPELAQSLAGRAEGTVGVRLAIRRGAQHGPGGPSAPDAPPTQAPSETPSLSLATDLELEHIRLRRRHGPGDDGLPRVLSVDGALRIGHDGSFSTRGLRLSSAGASLTLSGGFLPRARQADGVHLALDVVDGRAFADAFGIPRYVDRAAASLGFSGRVPQVSGPPGTFSAWGIGLPTGPGGSIEGARLWVERGTLKLRARGGRLFGGTGKVEADLVLASRGRLLSTPRLRALLDVDGMELHRFFGDRVSGRADLRLDVSDDRGRPVPLSSLVARAALYADAITYEGHLFGAAEARLLLHGSTLTVEHLSLPLHRYVSPFHMPGATIPVGRVAAGGTVDLSPPHELDLAVEADGVPIGLLAQSLGQTSPVRAQLAEGTKLRIRGPLRQPAAEGVIVLDGVHAGGIDLGRGHLRVQSTDVPQSGPLAAHREVTVEGDLRTDDGGMDVGVDAVIALGDAEGAVDAQADVVVARLSIARALSDLEGADAPSLGISGAVEGLRADLLACGQGAPMLTGCIPEEGASGDASRFRAVLEAERLYLARRRETDGDRTRRCGTPGVFCTTAPLRARIEGTKVALASPLSLSDKNGNALTVEGSFDLSPPVPRDGPVQACPAPFSAPEPPAGSGGATIRGQVPADLLAAAVAPELAAEGTVAVDVGISGPLLDPRVSGGISTGASGPVQLSWKDRVVGRISNLSVVALGDELSFSVDADVEGERLTVDARDADPSFVTYRGPCAGRFGADFHGAVSARLLAPFLGDGASLGGSMRILSGHVEGNAASPDPVSRAVVRGSFGGRHHLDLESDMAVDTIRVRGGDVTLEYCDGTSCRGTPHDGPLLTVSPGGRLGAEANSAPPAALLADVGDRGTARVWGRVAFDPDSREIVQARLLADLRNVTVRTHDGRGRAEMIAMVSVPNLRVEGAAPMVVQGDVALEDARWVKDALENVGLLSFLEPDPAVPEKPPPAALRDALLDLNVRTVAPLRVDNNIAEGVEARFDLHVGGTYDQPEFSGRMDIDPGGRVRLPLVGGTFEIREGRVALERAIEDAYVDVLAERDEPVYVDGQPRRFTLRLRGPLRAIRWECDTGTIDPNRAAEAGTDACIEFLLLGAGDVPATAANLPGTASSGLLYARKGLGVVSNVAEVDVTRQVERAVPRAAPYLPDVRLRLGQLGPEVEVRTPRSWFDFDYGHATVGFGYTRGYPGFLLRSNRDLSFRLILLDVFSVEARQSRRSYLNERIVFDPLVQGTFEAAVELEIPSLR